ncbi:hypothetical protein CR513_08108, partial [Mucuna pruriens]
LEASSFTVGENEVVRLQGKVFVPSVPELRKLILDKGHGSGLSMHLGATKMLLQPLHILEWKWDSISMDFVSGFPKTQKNMDG